VIFHEFFYFSEGPGEIPLILRMSAKGVSCSPTHYFSGIFCGKIKKIRRKKIMTIFGIYYPEPEGCRTNRVTLRLTDKEQEMLKDAAWKSKMSQAAFIRSKVFGSKVPELPAEVKDSLHRLDYSITKIGTNINQIARVANASGYVSSYEMRNLRERQEELEETCGRIFREIMKVYGNGSHETSPD